ncbi:TSUP family transporter [Tsuneonella sp. SYSU-LHT278]|uniref:TSUP family transporter n=1 Tax=Tsuneonella sediminis TaxID=3416089 RepID=UPI003F791D01
MESLIGFGWAQVAGALAAAFAAAYVRGIAGFGMAILLVPVLALAMSPLEAVLVTNGVSVLIGLADLPVLLRQAERSAWRIIGWVTVATAPGLWLLSVTPPPVARLLIALVALSAFLAVLLPRRPGDLPGRLHTGATGLATGLLTGFAGMPGPPVVPYYVGRDIPRAVAKASMLLVFASSSAVSLVSGAALGVLEPSYLVLAALLLPAVLAGNWLGARKFGQVEERTWRVIVALVLGATALVALAKLAF